VTLKFLGEIEEGLMSRLEEAAREALDLSGITGKVEWELDILGAFPSEKRPRVVWVGSSKEPKELTKLAARLEEALRPLGFEPERDRFVTHITLGRVKERGSGVEPLVSALRSFPPFRHSAQVGELTLMESRLTPQGAIYTPIFKVPFSRGGDGDAV
jgi:2'-5' RNA ligase